MDLSKADIEIMMCEYRNGSSLKQLAIKYGVVKSTVSRWAKIYNISRTAPVSKIYVIDDKTFIDAVQSSNSWEAIAAKLNGMSVHTHFRRSTRKRCADLGISPPIITQRKQITQYTKREWFAAHNNWWSASIPIRKHARKTYLTSGRPQKCAVCGYHQCIEIAHIKPVADFSDDTPIVEINNIDNLAALCPTHHWEFDNGLLGLNLNF